MCVPYSYYIFTQLLHIYVRIKCEVGNVSLFSFLFADVDMTNVAQSKYT